MIETWEILATAILIIVAVLLLRIAATRIRRPFHCDLPDLAVGLTLWLSTSLITLRPTSSALLWTTLAAGLALADHTKRKILREPVVFADAAELLQIFTHPRFYLPFVHPVLFYGIGSILVSSTAILFSFENPIFTGDAIGLRLIGLLLIVLPALGYFWRPSLNVMAYCMRRLRPTENPVIDAEQLGLLASFAVHTVLSREERPKRRAQATFGIVTVPPCAPPVVVVQAESFCDPRRWYSGLPPILPEYTACTQRAWRHGRLGVPAWGANTIRSEFACLSGLSSTDLGLDRFNPYHSFARRRVDTLAWRLREAGYATVCVHPYARSFYARNKVMPQLGFEYFIGVEEFTASRGTFVTDEALADWINRFMLREARPVFLFAISVANHGPWNGRTTSECGAEMAGYLDGLSRTDRMIGMLSQASWLQDRDGILAIYGDHQPSLSCLSQTICGTDTATDYCILDATISHGMRHDIDVHHLGHDISHRLAERASIQENLGRAASCATDRLAFAHV
ncbi:LTA synthase family protein [Gluconacetobacter tumulisoli]|uniref:LTA synthase family protein n=1 Tax=Gluconacetobacter tumulisoli TaxID=1286189 RepID=A0A7W4K672_9PROT|nr:LTA synthase family protein [Gluconacetobacter tumulisoli]MBB2201134.1 LTA synthase family protein [Gluconacetobacter tumulisoli]